MARKKTILVDDWEQSWRWLSVQMGALFGILGSVAFAAWPMFSWIIDRHMPDTVVGRVVGSVLVFLLFFGIPLIARLINQEARNGTSTNTDK